MFAGKISKIILLLFVFAVAGIGVVIYSFHHSDSAKLTDFSSAYERFDSAISTARADGSGKSDYMAASALDALIAGSEFRLSSFVEHDADLMVQAQLIADLAAEQLKTLKSCRKGAAGQNGDRDFLSGDYNKAAEATEDAYRRFQGLEGLLQ